MTLKSIRAWLRSGSSVARVAALALVLVAALALVLVLAALLSGARTARAAYPGANGVIAFEQNTQDAVNSPPPTSTASDAIRVGSRTITRCATEPKYADVPLASCSFGRLRYSPDGRTIVVSRSVPRDSNGDLGPASLALVGTGGTRLRLLPRQTRNDEDPAFLASGAGIVFAGRFSLPAKVNLFTVNTSGTGLRQLTAGGGSKPAPCRNGTIAFVKHGDIFLLARDRRTQRRITFRGGDDPDCSPDSHRIVFVRKARLYTIAANGQHLRHAGSAQALPNGSGLPALGVRAPVFSPDGREIAFLADYSNEASSDTELEIDRAGHRAAPARSIGSFGAGSNGSFSQDSSGISWQPVPHP